MRFQILVGVLLWSLLSIINFSHAQEFTLFVENSNVGVGAASPEAKLHVQDDENDYTRPLLVENTSGIGFSGFRLKIADNSWIDFNNSGGKFRINADQQPGSEFEVRPNGDATLSGALTQNSDVNAKQDLVMVNHDEVLAKVAKLPVSEWSYKDNPGARHIGPMAQDFHAAFGLGDSPTGISSIDTGGVALAAIKALKQEKNELKAELQKQEERIMQLEMVVAELMRNQTAEIQVGASH